jgi:hypothetical protein
VTLDDAGWNRLLAAARRKLEKTSGVLDGSVGVTSPTDAERRVIIGATGRYQSAEAKSLRVKLTELDDALRDAYGHGLLAVLAERDGPVRAASECRPQRWCPHSLPIQPRFGTGVLTETPSWSPGCATERGRAGKGAAFNDLSVPSRRTAR